MESSASEGYLASVAASVLPAAPLQEAVKIVSEEELPNFGRVFTATVDVQEDSLIVSCTNLVGTAISFDLTLGAALADLEDRIQRVCKWQFMDFHSVDGEALLVMSASLKDFHRIIVVNVTDRKRFELVKNTQPSVGKILVAMKAGAFDTSKDSKASWRLNSAPDVDPEQFDLLIDEALGNDDTTSDIDRCHFVKVLGYIVSQVETWNICNLQWLQCFDPECKQFRHQCYGGFLNIARMAAKSPIVPTAPPLAMLFAKSSQNSVIGLNFFCQDRQDFPLDLKMQNQLILNDIHVERDWSCATRSEILHLLKLKPANTANGLLKLKPANTSEDATAPWPGIGDKVCTIVTLMNIQLRLLAEVCPVHVQGYVTSDMAALLADSTGYDLRVVRCCGDGAHFRLHDVAGKMGGNADGVQGSCLAAHLNDSAAKANACAALGSLICIVGNSDDLTLGLEALCRHLQESAFPHKVRFVLCEGFVVSPH